MVDRRDTATVPAPTTTVRIGDWDDDRCLSLSGQQHAGVAFLDLDLTEAVDDAATFSECVFRGVRFNASEHTDAAFLNCTFARCSFFDASFTRCKLVGSLFDACSHDLLKVVGGDWSFVGLAGADLRKATFTGVRMREVDLTGARCDGATLRDLDLSGALWQRATLCGADLRGSDLTSLDPLTVEMRGAILGVDQAIVVAESLGLDVRPAG